MNYAIKVLSAMERRKVTELQICAWINVTPMTLKERFRSDDWWLSEIRILNEKLKIKL